MRSAGLLLLLALAPLAFAQTIDNTAFPREQIIRAIGHLEVAKPIRTTYQYNNDMFMTAGEAAGAAAAMPFDTFRKTRLFDPLGMTSTITSSAAFLAAPNHATGH